MPDPRFTIERDGRRVRLNRHESRMVQRGRDAGYQVGRQHPLGPSVECPYPENGRPRSLWLAGWRMGVPEGRDERAAVQRSYLAGLEQLEAGAPSPWRSSPDPREGRRTAAP